MRKLIMKNYLNRNTHALTAVNCRYGGGKNSAMPSKKLAMAAAVMSHICVWQGLAIMRWASADGG
jgi:hypothetical protein